jgi:hypothetical protein
MKKINLFTEEGRTRLRNARQRFCFYLVAWFLIAAVSGYAVYVAYVRNNLTPLQRVYFYSYFRSAVRSTVRPYFPLLSKSTCLILVRDTTDPQTKKERILAVVDSQVIPVLDDRGRVRLSEDSLPLFRLKPEVESQRFFWMPSTESDADRYEWFKKNFYEGQSFIQMLTPSALAAIAVFLLGNVGTITIDLCQNRHYLRGEVIRGPQLLTPKEYKRKVRGATGVGIEVYPQTKETIC